jgi:transglutaminase-like putative cysteine protease
MSPVRCEEAILQVFHGNVGLTCLQLVSYFYEWIKMHIKYGYHIDLACTEPTPLIIMLDVHPERRIDLTKSDDPVFTSLLTGKPVLQSACYMDAFGNICRRIIAPKGGVSFKAQGLIHDSGFPGEYDHEADIKPPQSLPDEVLAYLLGSRYCETDLLDHQAWSLFGSLQGGAGKVQAICNFVHDHIRFSSSAARATRTAKEAFDERIGVCRDYAHLAITLCRCLNIPARYCTGYLGDIGVPPDPAPGDFSSWMEVFLNGRWWTYDARHNVPRIGRILIARGRDATDVPLIHAFGAHHLTRFDVITEEVNGKRFPQTSFDRRSRWDISLA